MAFEPSFCCGSIVSGAFPTDTSLEELGNDRFDVVFLEQVLEHIQESLVVPGGLSPYL